MSGNARRTGKIEAARRISERLGISGPEASGGTIPTAWLRDVISKLYGPEAPDGASGKRALLRLAITLSGGEWSEDMVVMPGSTVTGEALWTLYELIMARQDSASRSTAPPPNRTSDEGALTVQIRPRVGMYSAFARLNYKPWYAIAEFVDNALQSFLAKRDGLAKVGTRKLRVEVRIEEDLIRVSDNACGIALGEMDRAFAPALPPSDRSGLSEFGIGMKAAACWFANRWVVRTSALGDPFERELIFDIPEIVARGLEQLDVRQKSARVGDHFTVIELSDLRVQPKGRTIGKIREHLASIYRNFLRSGDLELHFVTSAKGELLAHTEPEILTAPYFRTPDAEPVAWRKIIDMDVGEGQRVWGWAGLLAKASTTKAGFAVFRRNRLIEGSADDAWRPMGIFRTPNTYTYQRLTGEIQVEGFNVSHTKDGIQWGGLEEEIIQLLCEIVDAEPMPLIRQAEGHRVRKRARDIGAGFGQSAVDATGDALAQSAGPVIKGQIESPVKEPVPEPPLGVPAGITAERIVELRPRDDHRIWRVSIQVVRDSSEDWYTCRPPEQIIDVEGEADGREIWGMTIRLNLDHPFSESFINESEAVLVPVVRIVAGLALAETTAREAGTPFVGRLRRNFNSLLRYALAREESDA